MTATPSLLEAVLAVQQEAPTLPKNAVNPQRRRGWHVAQITYELGTCEYEGCDEEARDRHHIDEDPTNNAPENVARYCRRHHMLVDGRLAALAARALRASRTGGRKIDARQREQAERFLLGLLDDGPVAFNDVRRLTREHGLTWNSVAEAKKRLGVRSRRRVSADLNDWAWEKP